MRLGRRGALLSAGALALAGVRRARAEEGNFGPAPEFAGIANWIGSPPLTIAGLRGKVVLVDFWTYSCINCLRTLPYVTKWYDTYKDRGFVVVGVHTPEFAFERSTANVQRAMDRFGIHYPVAQDNAYATWKAYDNKYWPAHYLIDRNGIIVEKHGGEGDYAQTEDRIRALVAATTAPVTAGADQDLDRIGSPEMYFGLARVEMLASPETPREGVATYSVPKSLARNTFALEGSWNLAAENATLAADGGAIHLHFRSAKVFMVASSPQPEPLTVSVDGRAQPAVTVQDSRLYTLFDGGDYADHIMRIDLPKAGFQAYTFTFG